MLNSITSIENNKNIKFTSSENLPQVYGADKFIQDVNKTVKLEEQGDIFARNMWSQSAIITPAIGILGYETKMLYSIKRAKKAGDLDKLVNLRAKLSKRILPYTALAIVVAGGLEYIFSRNKEAKIEKFKQEFNEINTQTDAKLADRTFCSSIKGAYCSPISGEITVNKSMILDPYMRYKSKKLIKHELVHAKQYETIARSKDGIKKLNYACVKNISKLLDNPQARTEITQIFNDIQNDKTGKYDNYQLQISGAKVDLKKYITALHTALNNKDFGTDDIPVIIDEAHYQEVIDKKGKLTPEEEVMAEKYLDAQINYPALTVWNMLNPFSAYYNNLLEREAYKENPGFYGFIRKTFGY